MNKPDVQIFRIDTVECFDEFACYVEQENCPLFALDVETDNKSEKLANLYGIGLCFKKGQAVYIPIRNPDGSRVWSIEAEADIADWIYVQAQRRKMIGHNILYDALVLENNWQLDFSPYIYSDTILLKHAINEEQPFALKEVAVNYLGEWADKAQDMLKENVLSKGGRWNAENKDMFLADTDILAEYCCWDVILTMYLFNMFSVMLHREGLEKLFYDEETMPLYREVTIDMKRRGFNIDIPYYENLKIELEQEILCLEDKIMAQIEEHIQPFLIEKLNKEVPVKKGGAFPKALAEVLDVELPRNKKTGAITFSEKEVQKKYAQLTLEGGGITGLHAACFYTWLLQEDQIEPSIPLELIREAQGKIYFAKEANKDERYLFNLASSQHLGWLFFEHFRLTPLSYTEHGKPQCDDEFLNTIENDYPFVQSLIDYRKLEKLLSTYVVGILDRQLDGIIYTSMLQFGTISGRYASKGPNLQNQPRVKDEESGLSPLVLKYTNSIRRGFIAPPGTIIVAADFGSLEPVCFAHTSGDEKLKDVFRHKQDLYSKVAIESFGMTMYSADKKAENYLGKHRKEVRANTKVFVLAVPYGAEAARIAEAMNITYKEAVKVIDDYLTAFPGLQKYMEKQNYLVKTEGKVYTEFGRIRHLPKAKRLYAEHGDQLLDYHWAKANDLLKERREFKNALNNAKNFPIQGLGAHITNRCMIAIAREFKAQHLDASIRLQIHDEIVCISSKAHAERVKKIVQEKMEQTVKLSIPLTAEPKLAQTWDEAK